MFSFTLDCIVLSPMALRKHYGINNFRMLDYGEEKLNQFEIAKNEKTRQVVLVNQAMKKAKYLLSRCTIHVIHVEHGSVDKNKLLMVHLRRRFCFCLGSFMLTIIGSKNNCKTILPIGATLDKIDNLDLRNCPIKAFESFVSAASVTVSVTYYLPCCTFNNCTQ